MSYLKDHALAWVSEVLIPLWSFIFVDIDFFTLVNGPKKNQVMMLHQTCGRGMRTFIYYTIFASLKAISTLGE